ncbi:MAG TPA: SAM-dependent methyltransferase [Thermoanaerobaculia bacterium]
MSRLAETLGQRIAREGPISFSDFMAAALYDPDDGYYARGAPIGEPGDFATAPSLSPAFAGAIAREFRRETAGLEGAVDFVEAGAGEGRFLDDLAAALEREAPELSRRVRWTAVERSGAARRALAGRGRPEGLRVLGSAEELSTGSVRGWIFSNELFDALPVVRLEGGERGPSELKVGFEGAAFVWVRAPAPPEAVELLAESGVTLAAGQVAEVSTEAAPLYRRLARALGAGSLVTFDYGHRARVLYHAFARPRGTLAVHSGGRRGGDPLDRPGEVDLTAHVNWDALVRAGEEEGLSTRGIFRQGEYLARSGIIDVASTDAEKWRAYRLVDPEGMGEELSVLIQSRSIG